jgi:hypothetical protein
VNDIDAVAYHADEIGDTPTLNASIANVLIQQSPAHAFQAHPKLNPDWRPSDDDKFDAGKVAHQILLEGTTSGLEVCPYPDWRTGAAKEARAAARAAGRIPLLPHQADQIVAMCEAVRSQLPALEVDPTPLVEGTPEQTIVWTMQDVLCRARLDFLHHDLRAVDDVKTTARSANPATFARNLFAYGYDVQAAFYLRGLEALHGVRPEWRWLVVETTAPYALSVVTPGPDVLTLADAKIDHALALWARCLASGDWPGYTRKMATAGLPPWEESRWIEREDEP